MKAIQRLAVSHAVLPQLPAAMLATCILAAVVIFTAGAAPSGPTVVLIGGDKQGYPRTEHDYPDGILAIERLIKGSPQLQTLNPVVKSFPTGFPSDLSQIADADVVLLYFGMGYGTPMSHALDDAPRRAAMERLMSKGAGLIALHQASTVPDQKSAVPFADWLGGVRFGMADRSTEIAPVRIAGAGNPVANGLRAFEYLDEFYPTLTFSKTTKVTPILIAKVHIQTKDNKPVFEDPAADHVIGWAAERPNGGRSFGFTGAHYLLTFDQPQIRTALLNAILWTAKRDVPAGGATTNAPTMPHGGGRGARGDSATPQRVVLTKAEALVEPQPWGKLEWFASRALGNSTTMTVGMATISAGKENPLHSHPNCVEILHVLQGRIMNRVGDKQYEMRAGDTVTIPEGTPHNTRNIGTDDALLSITYSSPDRISIGEK
jgi:quercetin dioxygenase-like cupin family protein/type 1 glutamine amidotransferase